MLDFSFSNTISDSSSGLLDSEDLRLIRKSDEVHLNVIWNYFTSKLLCREITKRGRLYQELTLTYTLELTLTIDTKMLQSRFIKSS